VGDGTQVECGTLDVPLDYRHASGKVISVAISRIKASGTPEQRRGSLLINPGGPGETGIDYVAGKRAKMPEDVRRSYDIVGFDPRGVGHSAPVDCGPMGGRFDHPGADPVPTNDKQERDHLDRLSAMAQDCTKHIGDALPHINTANTARDMDRIRKALGDPKLTFLGVSYGSYLGAAYASEFPSTTGRMLLDSVVGPKDWHHFDLDQGFAMIEQRDVLFDWIAAHPTFGLGRDRNTVRDQYLHARAVLTRHPARGVFGPDEFDRFVYRTLSRTERWEPFARALGDFVHTGNSDGLKHEEDSPETRNSEAALRTVKCADSRRPRPSEVTGAIHALRAVDPQPVLTGMEASVCPFWTPPREPARLGHRDMPVVLLAQADKDPTTPYAGAKEMQAALPGSRMITLHDSYSHGVFASQRSTCVDATAANYLVHGVVPPADVHCPGPGLPTPLG
jgi:pimeloyl-ACP methyl ester carboxylesterase